MSASSRYGSSVVDTASSDPVVDVAGHLRELRSAATLALVFGLVVAAVVFGVRSLWPPTYQVVASARVVSAAAVSSSPAVAQAAGAPFVALSQDEHVLDTAANQLGLSSGQRVADSVNVTLSQAPGLVDIKVTDSDLDTARRIAETLIATMDATSVERAAKISGSGSDALSKQISDLDDRIKKSSTAGDQAAVGSLYTQRDELTRQLSGRTETEPARLQLLAMQTSGGVPTSPKPLGEAAVAGIVAALLAAEAIVLANGRLGSTVSPAWARRTARSRGMEVDSGEVEQDADTDLPLGADLVRTRLLDEGATVLMLGDGTADGTTVPAESATKRGADPGTDRDAGRVLRHSAESAWWREVDLSAVDVAFVVVDEGQTHKADTLEILDRLSLVDVPTRLVVREATDFSGPFGWLKI